jgi:cation diffusion facilitator family transporter
LARQAGIIGITIIGGIVNVLLAAAKVTVGFLAGSSALIADGIHSLSDLATDAIVLLGVKAARRPPDENHAFGHGRYETVSTLFVGFFLVLAGGTIGWHGVDRAIVIAGGGLVPAPRPIAVVVAAISILAKEVLFRMTRTVGRRQDSPVIIANAWHHRSDALSSVASFLGISGAILLGDRWVILDPVTAMIVAVLVIVVGVRAGVGALREMTDYSLNEEECSELIRIVEDVPGVSDPHNLKTRRLGPVVAVEIHFRVHGGMTVRDGHIRASEVERRIRARFGPATTVITHVEPEIAP